MELLQHENRIIPHILQHAEHQPINNNGKPVNLQLLNNNSNNASNTNIYGFEDQDLLSNMAPRNPVDIEFRNLSYAVNLGCTKGSKTILRNISGKFPGGQLIAIMGPSGAGKSTLLDVLSGFKTKGLEAKILVNGRKRDIVSFRKNSCYITQDDRLQSLLTVRENMRCAAKLKLGNTVSSDEKEQKIEEILQLLGLYDHEDTLTKQLSGGQRKRLSIALEMINNPSVMFLDEPTTGLDSHSCEKVIQLLKGLASQNRSIICTIHTPSARLFQNFDQVYVLSAGRAIYQGSSKKIVPFLDYVGMPCPIYHNPADYIIEIACEEYGGDSVDVLCQAIENGASHSWFDDSVKLLNAETLRRNNPFQKRSRNKSLEDTSFMTQLWVLMKRGVIKSKRDTTLTHLRIAVNIFLAIVLGLLYTDAGNEGSRVLDNYNLLFAILMHHSMTTMMLTVLTFPLESNILIKEVFNRWYSLKSYYLSITILDLPISILCCFLFTIIIYFLSSQPLELFRFGMFFFISLLTVFVGQAVGLTIGAWFNVVNGTFFAPISMIPMMMFAGFGVTLRDLPVYLKWGSYVSYLRYSLEGIVGSIYGENRSILECNKAAYCHYRYPQKFLSEITMRGDQFWNDVIALSGIIILFRVLSYYVLKLKLDSLH